MCSLLKVVDAVGTVTDTSRELVDVGDVEPDALAVCSAESDITDRDGELDDVNVVDPERLRDPEGLRESDRVGVDVGSADTERILGEAETDREVESLPPDILSSDDALRVTLWLRLLENETDTDSVLRSPVMDVVPLTLGGSGDADMDLVAVRVRSSVKDTEDVWLEDALDDGSSGEEEMERVLGRVKLFSRVLVAVSSAEEVTVCE